MTSNDSGIIQLDKVWLTICEIRDPITDQFKFKHLFRVAQMIPVIPHCNEEEERISAT